MARSLFDESKTDVSVVFFFVAFMLIASVILLNVVVAVLLDEFILSVTNAKEHQERLDAMEAERRKVTGCLDPLTNSLVTFEDEEDLAAKIHDIFCKLDEDGSGGLGFEEFRQGLRDGLGLNNIHMSREDFDIVTQNGLFLSQSEFHSRQFQEMMKVLLPLYCLSTPAQSHV